MTLANLADQPPADDAGCVYTVTLALTCKGEAGPTQVQVSVVGKDLKAAIADAERRLNAEPAVLPRGSGGGSR